MPFFADGRRGVLSKPPAPTTPSNPTSDGLEPSPHVTDVADEKPLRAKPLATGNMVVGRGAATVLGLGLVIILMGGAIGFLIKIELRRLLGWPKRLVS